MLNRFLCVAAALIVAACASISPGPAPVSAATGRARAPAQAAHVRSDPTTALLRAGTADAITTAEARALFGPPDVDRRDGAGALLVWRFPHCALTLGFANDRLHTVEPGPRRTGEAAPTLQTCIGEARSREATP